MLFKIFCKELILGSSIYKRIQQSGFSSQNFNLSTMRAPAKTFQDLIVWQKAHQFVLETYKCTKDFPQYELYALSSQFRKAAVSIAANIAEGFKKRGKKDTIRFLNISHGSLEECRYYILLSKDLGYGVLKHLDTMLQEVSKLLDGYSKAIQNSES